MKEIEYSESRRSLIRSGLGAAALALCPQFSHLQAKSNSLITKAIPSTGESIPVIGLGTSRTFDLSRQEQQFKLLPILESFFANGGGMIDSSPMYGGAEDTVGKLLGKMEKPKSLFSATKVWTDGKQAGVEQMQQSLDLWGLNSFDLMQIHNLRDWKLHLQTLREWKAMGKIRYIGITTSHYRFHDELIDIVKNESLDFLQFSYNIEDRVAEQRLLPLANDKGIAVIINRAFKRGDLFSKVKGKELPNWAAESDISSWGQYFLKFVVSHPYVSCAIPATSKLKHMVDNKQAGYGRLPDAVTRQKMISYLQNI